MYSYEVRIRLQNGQSTVVHMQAVDMLVCRQLAEAQYGLGNVMYCSVING